MEKKLIKKPLAAAIGTAFAATLAASPVVNADANPFGATALPSGYLQVAEGKCGEGKCGSKKTTKKEGNCGGSMAEGLCGANTNKDDNISHKEYMSAAEKKFKMMDANHDGGITLAEKKAFKEKSKGKKSEGSCGGNKKKEGSCGGMK